MTSETYEPNSEPDQEMDFLRPAGRTWYTLMCTFVAAVSIYDAFLVVRFSDSIRQLEQNPLGRLLIEIDGGHVGLFITTKMIGTAAVVVSLVAIYMLRRRLAYPVASGVSLFQAGLSCYLSLC